eukprot:scaffold25336_cov27-Tisochrysis_lutea.AAC.1
MLTTSWCLMSLVVFFNSRIACSFAPPSLKRWAAAMSLSRTPSCEKPISRQAASLRRRKECSSIAWSSSARRNASTLATPACASTHASTDGESPDAIAPDGDRPRPAFVTKPTTDRHTIGHFGTSVKVVVS